MNINFLVVLFILFRYTLLLLNILYFLRIPNKNNNSSYVIIILFYTTIYIHNNKNY